MDDAFKSRENKPVRDVLHVAKYVFDYLVGRNRKNKFEIKLCFRSASRKYPWQFRQRLNDISLNKNIDVNTLVMTIYMN